MSMSAKARIVLRGAQRLLRTARFEMSPAAVPLGKPEHFSVNPAIYDPEQLDRVVAFGFDVPMSEQLDTLNTRQALSTPATRAELTNVVCWGGQIYSNEGQYRFGPALKMGALLKSLPHYTHVALANSRIGLEFFGHWLRDDCAAMELPLPSDATVLSLQRPDWPDCGLYEKAFGQTWIDTPAFQADKLTIFNDLGFGPDKRSRLTLLAQRLRDHFPNPPQAGQIVYIKRGPGGQARTLANEDALTAALERSGVRVIEAEVETEVLLSQLVDASMVIGVEGSQLSHAVYTLGAKASLLVLQPPDRFYCAHHVWSRSLGVQYGMVIGRMAENGFEVDPGEVFAMIDRLLAATAGPAEV